MAPRKIKPQAKKNNPKMKSKPTARKREPKVTKKMESVGEKPLNSLKWLNNVVAESAVKKCDTLPDWFKNNAYKHKVSSETNISEYEEYQIPQNDEEKSASGSDLSEECNCSNSKYNSEKQGGILKTKSSSSSSLVAKYIRSGMNQVASFIVESAIRFGEQHGVVVPDKDTPNLYEVTPPDSRFQDKYRKIRFKVPRKTTSYEDVSRDAKKAQWKNYSKQSPAQTQAVKRAQTPMPEWTPSNRPTKSSSWESTPDSLEEILPILEKLKDGGEIVSSDLDIEKLRQVEGDGGSQVKDREWRRGRERERERERERDRSERERSDRERTERERVRSTDRGKEILRQKLRTLKKRYKSLGGESEKDSEDTEFLDDRSRWKKARRDSVELVRERLRASAGNRKQENLTSPPY